MKVRSLVKCEDLPCEDVNKGCYVVPSKDISAEDVRIIMISECPPEDLVDYLYARGKPLQLETTVAAFGDAGIDVTSMKDILDAGVYLTTALKCGKKGYNVSAKSIQNCSVLLEKEIALFPNVEIYLLMGDVAIKAMNAIAKRQAGKRAIPAGSTYKIRGGRYTYQGKRVFPSYLQAGPAFFIEKSKRRMIKEDISKAFALLKS
jgi:uracil-DNA glycosylase